MVVLYIEVNFLKFYLNLTSYFLIRKPQNQRNFLKAQKWSIQAIKSLKHNLARKTNKILSDRQIRLFVV